VRRLTWLAVLVAGVLAYLAVLRVMVSTQNVNYFPSLLLIGSITVPASVLVLAGSRSGARLSMVALTAVVGGVVGTVAAGNMEYSTLRGLGVLPMTFVGIIEEAAKLIVPLAVVVLTRPRDPRGGVVIGIASGTGFATLETMGYGFQALLRAGNVAAVDQTLLLRALLAPAGHVAWTGLTVAMLWRIPSAQHKARAVLTFLGAYVLAVALHATWDASTSLAAHVVVAVVSLVLLLVLVRRSHRTLRPGTPAPAGLRPTSA
jgi:RsiW-degrading membrane proteinase PrsW (M82 family)